jgi:hypothetical protein
MQVATLYPSLYLDYDLKKGQNPRLIIGRVAVSTALLPINSWKDHMWVDGYSL